MIAPENVMSVRGQHVLRDMVESQMYLVAQSQQTPWPMLPRRIQKAHEAKAPFSNLVESSVARELLDQGLIEASSSRTFVVSKSGHEYYGRHVRRTSDGAIRGLGNERNDRE
jgi:hypothetical protein